MPGSHQLVSQVVSRIASALFEWLWSLKTDEPIGMNIFSNNILRTSLSSFELHIVLVGKIDVCNILAFSSRSSVKFGVYTVETLLSV